ncbi:MAG: D-aminoacyl-tRNA deacylase [Peptoniphilaceae bacterium]|nr:D-aminoacyl-tRNA deacylase [Peptoniphilaceae bacterium]MDY6086315.1 D-aminoacyl-tRNA deacylase [Peptoniphilaceae bacterium]
MRALVQCVLDASVEVEGTVIGAIDRGYLIYLGVGPDDGEAELEKLWKKIIQMRVFMDENGKTNLSLDQVGGNVLIVSQFTLYASMKRGNRPSFATAAPPAQAEALYDLFVARARKDLPRLQTGQFGADMKVRSTNDGPFTIWLDTAEL